MKTKVKIYIIAASLGFLNTQAFTASSGLDQRDHFRFDRINPAGQDIIVENNYYYGDGDYIYDYYYASRIRRFHKPYVSYSYYNSYYTDCYWYTYEPIFWGMSIYLGSMWNPVGLTISYGFPFRSYYRSYYYDSYPLYPVYNIVYRPRIVNRYYFNTWYGNRIRYSRPFYANRYGYHYNTWNSNYGNYSHSDSYAYNYRASNSYRSNRVIPSQTSKNRDINRNSDTYNSRRRTIQTNTTGRTRYENRNAEKSTQVTTNTDVRRRNTVSGRTTIENKNSARNRSSVTETGLKNTNTRTVTNTRRSNYVPRRNETGRSVYKAPQKSSTRSRVSSPVDNRRSQSYRSSTPKNRSSVKATKSGRSSSSKKVTKSSRSSRSKASKSRSGGRSSSKKSSGRKR